MLMSATIKADKKLLICWKICCFCLRLQSCSLQGSNTCRWRVVPFVMSEMAGHSERHFPSAETENIVCCFQITKGPLKHFQHVVPCYISLHCTRLVACCSNESADWFPVTAEIHAATQEEDSGLFLFLVHRFSHHGLYRQLACQVMAPLSTCEHSSRALTSFTRHLNGHISSGQSSGHWAGLRQHCRAFYWPLTLSSDGEKRDVLSPVLRSAADVAPLWTLLSHVPLVRHQERAAATSCWLQVLTPGVWNPEKLLLLKLTWIKFPTSERGQKVFLWEIKKQTKGVQKTPRRDTFQRQVFCGSNLVSKSLKSFTAKHPGIVVGHLSVFKMSAESCSNTLSFLQLFPVFGLW